MCLEYLEALKPEGRSLQRRRQMEVFNLGDVDLFFQTRLRIVFAGPDKSTMNK